MNGSDSERMMAQIEAFLRTGEGPPAAPEPEPVRVSPLPPTRPFDLDEVELFVDRPPAGPPRRPGWPAVAGPPPGAGHLRRRLLAGRRGLRPAGRRAGGHAPGWPRAAAGPPRWTRAAAGPPRWTPLRVFVVVTLLLGLTVLPVIWSNHARTVEPDGTDRASAAPAGPDYAFVRVDRTGRPFRWNPCEAIHYRTDLTAAPAWAAADVQAAVEQVMVATGILFVDDGDAGGAALDPTALGTAAQPAPVVIQWARSSQAALSSAVQTGGSISEAGMATGSPALARTRPVASVDEMTGHGVFVTGSVVVDPAARSLRPGFRPGGLGVLLLQQMAHLLGLAYTDAPGQVMYPGVLTTTVDALGPGDRAGLHRLGTASGCLAAPPGGTLEPSV